MLRSIKLLVALTFFMVTYFEFKARKLFLGHTVYLKSVPRSSRNGSINTDSDDCLLSVLIWKFLLIKTAAKDVLGRSPGNRFQK